MGKRNTPTPALARVVNKAKAFEIKKASVLAPFDTSTNRLVLCQHTFHKTDKGVLHRCDGMDRAAIDKENWPAYVKSNAAAAMACEYAVPMDENPVISTL